MFGYTSYFIFKKMKNDGNFYRKHKKSLRLALKSIKRFLLPQILKIEGNYIFFIHKILQKWKIKKAFKRALN